MKFSGLSIRQLEAFDMTLQTGSVSRAALALHISQPSVSRLLQDLERDTGLRLFDRSQGRLVPTVEGQLFYAEVEKTFCSAQRLMETAEQIRVMQRGAARLGVMASVSLERVPAVMGRFSSRYPNATLSLSVCESPRIVEAVSAKRMDLGVISADTALLDACCLSTIYQRYLCVMESAHPLANHEAIEIEDFSQYPFVSLGQDYLKRSDDGRRLAHAVAGNIKAETYQSFLACALVRGSNALAIIDPFTADFYARVGMVVKPLRADIPYEISVIANERSRSALTVVELSHGLIEALSV